MDEDKHMNLFTVTTEDDGEYQVRADGEDHARRLSKIVNLDVIKVEPRSVESVGATIVVD